MLLSFKTLHLALLALVCSGALAAPAPAPAGRGPTPVLTPCSSNAECLQAGRQPLRPKSLPVNPNAALVRAARPRRSDVAPPTVTFTSTGGPAVYAVPADGYYRITARGAAGGGTTGRGTVDAPTYVAVGGVGAEVVLRAYFTKDQVLDLVIGAQGERGSSLTAGGVANPGGGGGGTFASIAGQYLVASGGGGGASTYPGPEPGQYPPQNGRAASLTTTGIVGAGQWVGGAASNGNPGAAGYTTSGGGAGIKGDASSSSTGGKSAPSWAGGPPILLTYPRAGGAGGYGGGGGGGGSGGGGGGGYSGGGGGQYEGGGGGTFVAATFNGQPVTVVSKKLASTNFGVVIVQSDN